MEADDPVEIMVCYSIIDRFFSLRKDLDQQLATMIINKLGEAMK